MIAAITSREDSNNIERKSIPKELGHIPNLGLAADCGMFISLP